MRKTVLITLLLSMTICAFAQNIEEGKLKELYDREEYDAIREGYTLENLEYSAISLYYIGVAYMMIEDDVNCIKLMDLSIAKDSLNPAPFYTKASSLLYQERLDDAIPVFQKAISIDSDSVKLAQSYRGLGYAYYHLGRYNLAIDAYRKAIDYNKTIPTPYIMIAQAYNELGQEENSLKYYYEGKEKASKDKDEYITILFNIGLVEQMAERYKEAQSAYLELISLNPNDYHTYAKLIQIHYKNKEYDKAEPYRKILYQAHNVGVLPENMSDMFCIDQFRSKDRLIQVFERYEEGDKSTIYNKIMFYVIDEDGEIEYRIQTEYSPAAVALKSGKYMLCANKDGAHLNYGIIFDDNTKYDKIKKEVISILEKETVSE